MALETGTYISDFVTSNPAGTDNRATADDHIRLMKTLILATFPNITGAVTVTHGQLNFSSGVTSNIQTQLDSFVSLLSGKQAVDTDLTTIAALAKTNNNFIVGNGSAWTLETPASARSSLGLAALATLNSVAAAQIDADAVGQSEIAGNSVGQSEIKTTYQEVNVSVPPDGTNFTNFTPTGGIYLLGSTFYCSGLMSEGYATFNQAERSLTTSILASLTFTAGQTGGSTRTVYGRAYYINSSPPYDLGFGNIPLFIFLKIDNASQKIENISVSVDAPWHYNGSTDIIPSRYGKDGKAYKNVRQGQDVVEVELTQEIKNADMVEVPHVFSTKLVAGKTFAVINPQNSIVDELLVMHDAGVSVAELFMTGAIVIDKRHLPRGFAPMVKCYDISWA